MQPSARKEWMSIQVPDSDVSFGGVKASLAQAEVDTILLLVLLVLLVLFTEPFHNNVLTQHCISI